MESYLDRFVYPLVTMGQVKNVYAAIICNPLDVKA